MTADLLFRGPGEMRARCRALDWTATPLGAVDRWPAELQGVVRLAMAAPIGMIVLWGPELVQVYNDAYCEVMGAKHPAGLGQRNRECWPEVRDFTDPIYRRVLEHAEACRFEDQRLMLERHGYPEETYFTLSYTPVANETGAVGGMLVTVVETTRRIPAVTHLERARAEAQAARERTEAVLGSIADAFYLLDREWRFTHVNDAAEPLLKTTRAALLGRTMWDAFPDVIGSVFETPYREAMTTGRTTSVEAYFAPLGAWFDVRTYPWAGGLMVHFRDVSVRKAAEGERERLLDDARTAAARTALLQDLTSALSQALTREEVATVVLERIAAALGAHLGVLALVTPDGAHLAVAAADWLSQESWGAWATFPLSAPVPLAEAARERRTVALPNFEAIVAHAPMIADLCREHGTAAVCAVPIAAAGGRVVGTLGLSFAAPHAFAPDFLALLDTLAGQAAQALERARLFEAERDAREAAEAAREAAERANKTRAEFLASMSHELRTPLNAIQGYVQLLDMGLHGPVTDDQRVALDRVQRAQTHLLALVNDVLNFAKLEAGRVTFDVRATHVSEAIGDVVPLIEPQLRSKGLQLTVSLPDDPGRREPPIFVMADREKLGQVLLNLLSNAIKFTPAQQASGAPGCVEVTLTTRDTTPEVAYLRVSDTGIGIPRERQDVIFDPFVQLSTGHTRTAEGTGLGLAISRDLARGMGGDLRVRSAPGEGSTFTVTLQRVSTL